MCAAGWGVKIRGTPQSAGPPTDDAVPGSLTSTELNTETSALVGFEARTRPPTSPPPT